MFKHYLINAIRNLQRDKFYAAINLIGLSVAVACGIFISIYARSELSYDQHNQGHERIYRVANELTTNGQSSWYALSSRAIGPLMLKSYPQIGEYVRVRNLAVPNVVVRYQEQARSWDDIRIADENIFDVFTHESVFGDLSTALEKPASIAISESFSKAYFGDSNPVGKTLSTDVFSYTVTAVFKDLPANTHLKYSALISMNRIKAFGIDDDNLTPQLAFNIDVYTYFKLAEGIDQSRLDSYLAEYARNNLAEISEVINTDIYFVTQSLSDIHFDSRFRYDLPTGNIFYLLGFIALGVFIIVIACINYTNLSTARALKRSKEIGMRKVLGAEKSQLVVQFLGESVVLTLIALVFGVLLVALVTQFTSTQSLLNLDIGKSLSDEPLLALWVFVGTLATGLLAGAYPAFYLSSIAPNKAIGQRNNPKIGLFDVRQSLLFLQFLISIGVIACTIVMGMQMRYVSEKPLGFEKENRIAINLRGVDLIKKEEVIRNELLKNENVTGVTTSSFIPGDEVPVNLMLVENNQGQMEETTLNQMAVGKGFLDVMDIKIEEGRDFSQRLLTDVGTSVLVNQTLVESMGWDDPIGKRIQFANSRVIGVIRDFHFSSLHDPVAPLMIRAFPADAFDNVPPLQQNLVSLSMIVSMNNQNVFSTIQYIESVISTFNPKNPFEFEFLDALLEQQYASEINLIYLTAMFAAVCIFISCLGLFALTAFNTEQRTKEIGVRKVLGATRMQILLLISKPFLILVVLASVIASLISYWLMTDWLALFAYRTSIEIWVFIVATVSIAAIAFITVATQSMKAASANPVESLRYE